MFSTGFLSTLEDDLIFRCLRLALEFDLGVGNRAKGATSLVNHGSGEGP